MQNKNQMVQYKNFSRQYEEYMEVVIYRSKTNVKFPAHKTNQMFYDEIDINHPASYVAKIM